MVHRKFRSMMKTCRLRMRWALVLRKSEAKRLLTVKVGSEEATLAVVWAARYAVVRR